MNSIAFNQKIRWVRRRARRLMNFYHITRELAVLDAHLDWISLNLCAIGACHVHR